ncbi:MAG TPA: ATP-binding protein [Bacteroidales bacterium]|jgi:anti-sigma regulatory factor (Ser/Thr protein kinase)|nr:ATP-binding protein [Bacteroidales bacterium]MDI9533293.1 ATP-binding protein [Bacteroidota bacterium]OPZ56563.1 MAG: Serine/threonine-protein kinase RsbT [Bacteroidetes bacterium ADurb.BinA012]MBK7731292.1 ATP-binding protein [Bacteroidales bacterium]MBP7036687.1 ATP-binding protein [Bacteroidales bacterium]
MTFEYKVQGGDFTHAGYASSQVKKMLKQLDVDNVVIKRVVVCLYEAEVNIVAHAWDGVISIVLETDTIFMKLTDNGPGIPNIEQAMQRGFSTASHEVREMGFGAGMGLPNISANADKFLITSEPGKGTTVEITINLNSTAV